jgi:hypothetical protein
MTPPDVVSIPVVPTEWCRCYASIRPHTRQTYRTPPLNLWTSKISRVAFPILPPRAPPFFPPRAVERVFAQFLIHRVMCLAHPRAELASARYSWRIPRHPGLEIFGANPARVQLPECGEEGLGLGLELRGRLRRVGGGYGVQQHPSACAEAMEAEAEAVVLSAVLVAFLGLLPVMANQEATSVQVRHLTMCVSHDLYCCALHMAVESSMASGAFSIIETHGLPSGPSTTPLGNLVGAACSLSCFSPVSTCPGAIFSPQA